MIACSQCGFQQVGYGAACQRCASRSQSGQHTYNLPAVPIIPTVATISSLPSAAQVSAVARPFNAQQNTPVVPVVHAVPIHASTTASAHRQPVVVPAFPVASTGRDQNQNKPPTSNTSNVQSHPTITQREVYSNYPYNPEYTAAAAAALNGSNSCNVAVPSTQEPNGRKMKNGAKWGTFVGQVNNRGERHGFGSMKYDDGSEYKGLWKNNMKDGSGTFIYSSGPKLVASWAKDKVHGSGTYYYPDGRIDLRMYRNDECIGDGVQYSQDLQVASKLNCGRVKKYISLTEASKIASKLGLPVPR